MKATILVILCLIVTIAFCEDISLENLKLTYTVPSSPAFEAINIKPTNTLYPSSSQEFALSILNYYAGKKTLIPESYSTEFAPFFLFNPKLTLTDYVKLNLMQQSLYETKLSMATNKAENGIYDVSLGLRFSLMDQSDLKRNKKSRDEYIAKLQKTTIDKTTYGIAYAKSHNIKLVDFYDDNRKSAYDSMLVEFNAIQEAAKTITDSDKTDAEDDNWRNTKIECAVAVVMSSEDSLAANVEYKSFHFWFVCSSSLSEKWMFLTSPSFVSLKTDDTYFTGSIPFRFYYGVNETKGFVEAQYSYETENEINKLSGRMGLSKKLPYGLWADCKLAFLDDITNKKSQIQYDLNLNYGF